MKITLWIGAVLGVLILVTYLIFFMVSNAVLQKSLQKDLIRTVTENYDEIAYYSRISEASPDSRWDLFIRFQEGYLEVDDDFLKAVNGITTALYQADGTLLYGENPIVQALTDPERKEFRDAVLWKKRIEGITWYIYDRALTGEGLEGLYLRGIVPSLQGQMERDSILRILLIILPLLLLLGLPAAYLIADRSLGPVRRIIGTAEQISRGEDLGRRIGLGRGGDEIHRLAGAFDEMFDRLEASFEAEKQFTSDASHELRTPLSVILAQCQIALEEEQSPEDYREALRLIRRQGGRMSWLIEDMLQLSRLERKTDSYKKEVFDLSASLQDLCEEMAILRERDITMEWKIEKGILMEGNEELIRRMVSNLISNAYRYGREGGRTRVCLQRLSDSRACIEVEDNGPGIAEEDLVRIFDRFYQADPSRMSRGAGLGLSIVRQIASFHGGMASAESVPGKGSIFRAELPCKEKDRL